MYQFVDSYDAYTQYLFNIMKDRILDIYIEF